MLNLRSRLFNQLSLQSNEISPHLISKSWNSAQGQNERLSQATDRIIPLRELADPELISTIAWGHRIR